MLKMSHSTDSASPARSVLQLLKQPLLALALVAPLMGTANASTETWTEVRKAGELRCGSAVSAPVVMRDLRTGDYSGPFAALCKKFGEEVLKVKVTFVDATWDTLVAGLQTGKWHMALALNRTAEREKSVGFTAPLIYSTTNFVFNPSNPKIPKGASTIADLDQPNVTVAVMQGTYMDRDVTKSFKKAKLVRLTDADATRLSFVSRRADVLADTLEANAIFHAANPKTTTVMEAVPAFEMLEMGFGVNKEIPAADLELLNAFIASEIASGDVKKNFDAAALAAAQAAK